ncbi:hypothetical protein AAULR_08231 [Lacticaseibacillus rhamnosus MTCC 5462]|nr:hypothetical protein AAULR_08231 [Lacticaseibacillus rhamnosus MTCC 5462]
MVAIAKAAITPKATYTPVPTRAGSRSAKKPFANFLANGFVSRSNISRHVGVACWCRQLSRLFLCGEDFGALGFGHLCANRSCIEADAFFLERLGLCNCIGEGLCLFSRDGTFVLADPNTCGFTSFGFEIKISVFIDYPSV